jgi:hypothetical protein
MRTPIHNFFMCVLLWCGLLAVPLSAAAVPVLTTVSPASGLATGGTSVTITGSNFTNGNVSAVTFGGTAAASFSITNDSQLVVVTPAKTAGNYALVVTNTAGATTWSSQFDFLTANTPALGVAISASMAQTLGICWTANTTDGTTAKVDGATSAVTWALGTIAANTTRTTVTAPDAAVAFEVRNVGNCRADLTVSSGDSADWTIAAAPGIEQFYLGVSTTGGAPYTALAAGSVVLGASALADDTRIFDLKFTAPVSTAHGGAAQTITATVTAY